MMWRQFSWAAGVAAVLSTPLAGISQDGVPKADELFKTLDKNSDGKLTADEIPAEQRRFFERSVRVGDQNGDGALTLDEFVKANKPQDNATQPLGPLGSGAVGGSPGGSPRERFQMLDRNKDGKLTLDEVPEQFRDRLKGLFDRLGKTEINLEEFSRGAPGGAGMLEPGAFFTRLDKNGDGKLTKDEIPEEFKERMSQAFERIGKEEITRDEFAEMGRRMMAQAGGQPPARPNGGPMLPGLPGQFRPAFFRRLDADGDGRISKDELAKAASVMAEMDADGDGYLDPRELMGPPPEGFGGPLARPNDRPEMRRPEIESRPQPTNATPQSPVAQVGSEILARMDKNGDGKISKDEAPERMKGMFDRLDKNGDGYLSPDELREAGQRLRDRRPNSRPTDGERPGRPPGEAQ